VDQAWANGWRLTVTRIGRRIVIDRPVEAVFGFVHDATNDARWQTTIVESRVLTPGRMGIGTRVAQVRRFLGVRFETAFEVTAFEPYRSSSVRTVSGPIPAAGSYLFDSLGQSTRLTGILELEAAGLFSLAEPVFARMASRELETNLGHLKDLIESEAEATSCDRLRSALARTDEFTARPRS
jgi:hypothetical protein